MRVSKEQAAENRERIVDAAAKLYREHGFSGIGVADLMRQAGLTHGGFYGHFASKDDLIAQSCERAANQTLGLWSADYDKSAEGAFAAIQRHYLTPRHRDDPGNGCLFAAVGADIRHQSPAVRQTVTRGLRALIEKFTQAAPGKSQAAKREKAIKTFSTLVGAVVLARAVDDAKFSSEILHAALSLDKS